MSAECAPCDDMEFAHEEREGSPVPRTPKRALQAPADVSPSKTARQADPDAEGGDEEMPTNKDLFMFMKMVQ